MATTAPPSKSLTLWFDLDAYNAAVDRALAEEGERVADIGRRFAEAIAAGAVTVPTNAATMAGRSRTMQSRSLRLRTTIFNDARSWLATADPTMPLGRLLAELLMAYGERRADLPAVKYGRVKIAAKPTQP